MIPFMASARSQHDTEHYCPACDYCEFCHQTLVRKLAFRHFKCSWAQLNLDQTRVAAAACDPVSVTTRAKPLDRFEKNIGQVPRQAPRLPQSEVARYEEHHHNNANDVKNIVHVSSSFLTRGQMTMS